MRISDWSSDVCSSDLWLIWSHGSSLVDENNKVVIDNDNTIKALEYAKKLYATFIPGTSAWLDPSNNKAFLAGQIGLTANGITVYYAAKNSPDEEVRTKPEDNNHQTYTPGSDPNGHKPRGERDG